MSASNSRALNVLMPKLLSSKDERLSYHPIKRINQIRNQFRGPEAVLSSVLTSLRRDEIRLVNSLESMPSSGLIWIPSGSLKVLSDPEIDKLNSCRVALGPNIDWFNDDNLNVISKISHPRLIAPADWVIPIIREKVGLESSALVWAAGLDLTYWNPSGNHKRQILIYLKTQNSQEELLKLEGYIRSLGFIPKVIRYGQYSRIDFRKNLDKSYAAIWMGGTESQGIALFECWAMNVPTLVIPRDFWKCPEGRIYPASSAPYLEDALGKFFKATDITLPEIGDFLKECAMGYFEPRKIMKLKYSSRSRALSLIKSIESGF